MELIIIAILLVALYFVRQFIKNTHGKSNCPVCGTELKLHAGGTWYCPRCKRHYPF